MVVGPAFSSLNLIPCTLSPEPLNVKRFFVSNDCRGTGLWPTLVRDGKVLAQKARQPGLGFVGFGV